MGGRPKSLDDSQVKVAITLAEAGELTIREIGEQVGCSRSLDYEKSSLAVKPLDCIATKNEEISSYLESRSTSLVFCCGIALKSRFVV